MKTISWIFLVIGGLSFLGAALKGDSVFGPLFWIGLGAFLLHRANNKEKENDAEPIDIEIPTTEPHHDRDNASF